MRKISSQTWAGLATVLLVVVAAVGAIVSHNFYDAYYRDIGKIQQELTEIQDQLNVTKAVYATGPCGNKRIVVLDAQRVAVAGKVVKPGEVENLKWSETIDREGRRVETLRDKWDTPLMIRTVER